MSKTPPMETAHPGDSKPPEVVHLRSTSPRDTEAIGEVIAGCALPRDVITLDGELGAGTTQLVRGLARGLKLDPAAVSSPTFVLSHEYERDSPESADAHGAIQVLVHIDAYRLEGEQGLSSIGWDVATSGAELRREALVVIEWGQRVRSSLGVATLEIQLEHAADDRRELCVVCPEAWAMRGLRSRLTRWIDEDLSTDRSRRRSPAASPDPSPPLSGA